MFEYKIIIGNQFGVEWIQNIDYNQAIAIRYSGSMANIGQGGGTIFPEPHRPFLETGSNSNFLIFYL